MTGFCTLSYNWSLKNVDHRLLEGVRPGTGTTLKPGFHRRISISIRRGAHAEWYQDDGRSIRRITFDMFAWGLGQSHLWLVHGLVLMLVQYVDPVFTSQSYDISRTTIKPGFHRRISISIRRGAHAEWYQDDGRSIRRITFDMFAWGLGQSHLWLVHGLVLMLVQYVDPVFTSQSYDISISTNTRRTNFTMSVFLVDPVFTWLHMCLCLC